MITSVIGIVLGEMHYQESSKILTVLTKEYGIISILSKGCRKYTNKLNAVSNSLIVGKFHFRYKKDKLMTLIEADAIDALSYVKNDFTNITYVSYVTKLTKLISQNSYDQEIFDLYMEYLDKIKKGIDIRVLTIIIELKYLTYLGIKPITNMCYCCNSDNDIVTISVDNYGVVCKNCVKDEFIFDIKVVKLIDIFLNVEFKNIDKLTISDEIIKQLNKFIESYYDKHSGLYISKNKFINVLNDIKE